MLNTEVTSVEKIKNMKSRPNNRTEDGSAQKNNNTEKDIL